MAKPTKKLIPFVYGKKDPFVLYSVNNTQLNVLELGNGPQTLVFLHYFGGSALEWQTVMDQFANQYRCLAVDYVATVTRQRPKQDTLYQ